MITLSKSKLLKFAELSELQIDGRSEFAYTNRLEHFAELVLSDLDVCMEHVTENGEPHQQLAALKAENESLKRDAERLDWMERKSEESRSGVTFQRVRYAEDGNVVESGYRVMSFHNIGELHQTLRVAIDAAMAQGE